VRFYFRFCPVEGCMSVNMFTFEADTRSTNVGVGESLAQSPLAVGPVRGISPSTYTSPPSEAADGRDSVSLRARPWAIKIAPPL
jgi:hypothetical protein